MVDIHLTVRERKMLDALIKFERKTSKGEYAVKNLTYVGNKNRAVRKRLIARGLISQRETPTGWDSTWAFLTDLALNWKWGSSPRRLDNSERGSRPGGEGEVAPRNPLPGLPLQSEPRS